MLEILGEMYYIDLNELSDTIDMSIPTISGETEQTINLVSFEVLKMMLRGRIMTEREEVDENLGIHVRELQRL